MRKPWFGAKDYGFGLSPKSPAGWATLAIYVVVMAATPRLLFMLGAPGWVSVLVAVAATLVLLLLVVIKSDGGPWRWRWGRR